MRAFGQFGIRISDFRVFLTGLIGTLGDDQVVKYDTVTNYFKGITVTKVKTMISNLIINEKLSVLEITPQLETLSDSVEHALSEEFERFGIEVVNFYINSINFPDEDFDAINKILGEKAAFDIIGDKRYNVKRTFDVMEGAANNEADGGMAAAGLGFGLGSGAGLAMGNLFTANAGQLLNTRRTAAHIPCRKCGEANEPDDKFCSGCGEKLVSAQIECYSCKEPLDAHDRFCSNCGSSMLKKPCPGCGKEQAPGVKFCSDCGTRMEA
ncbi:Double zinc ribbon [compost metagenome]